MLFNKGGKDMVYEVEGGTPITAFDIAKNGIDQNKFGQRNDQEKFANFEGGN